MYNSPLLFIDKAIINIKSIHIKTVFLYIFQRRLICQLLSFQFS